MNQSITVWTDCPSKEFWGAAASKKAYFATPNLATEYVRNVNTHLHKTKFYLLIIILQSKFVLKIIIILQHQ